MAVQAIETEYKGYRFRSRTEARWAVVLDHLEIPWEYEVQGFELPSGLYLPDFWLPRQQTWVEIKGSLEYDLCPIYFAGKVSPSDWRFQIFDPFLLSNEVPFNDLKRGISYCGPFFLSDDHGCCHGPASHGRGADCTGEYPYGDPRHAAEDWGTHSAGILYRSLEEIRACSIVFAWIDALDCYGTLAEIGYAAALGRAVYIGVDAGLDVPKGRYGRSELWFVLEMAQEWTVATKPIVAFNLLLRPWLQEAPESIQKCHELACSSTQNVLLVAGSPNSTNLPRVWTFDEYTELSSCFTHRYSLDIFKNRTAAREELWGFFLPDGCSLRVANSLRAGQQARFEHGEKG